MLRRQVLYPAELRDHRGWPACRPPKRPVDRGAALRRSRGFYHDPSRSQSGRSRCRECVTTERIASRAVSHRARHPSKTTARRRCRERQPAMKPPIVLQRPHGAGMEGPTLDLIEDPVGRSLPEPFGAPAPARRRAAVAPEAYGLRPPSHRRARAADVGAARIAP